MDKGDRMGLVLPLTVLDDYSRYIIAWTLSTGMAATDVDVQGLSLNQDSWMSLSDL